MKPSILLFALTATCAVSAEEMPPSPDLGRASVTIPYSELRALWEAGVKRKEPPKEEPEHPPVDFLVPRADYRLQFGEEAGRLDAEYEIESLGNKWQTIPLLGGQARLDKADTGGLSLISKDGYALLTNQPGKAKVSLHLVTPGVRVASNAGAFKLRLGSATVKRLSIGGVPANLELRVDGMRAGEVVDGAALFYLSGEATEVSIELAAPREDERPKPVRPSHWQIQPQVLVKYADGALHFRNRILTHADDGSGMEMLLQLPANTGAVAVEGEDIAEWSATRADNGQRLLRVHWKTRDVLDRDLTVAYALPQSPLAEQWNLPVPSVAGQANGRTFFAIVLAEGMELKGEGVQAAVASQRLPAWMRTEIGGAAFVTADAGAALALTAHWLPTVATAEAIVSETKCELRLVSDGSTQTSATYSIRHAAPLAWPVELPADVELLTCSVDGRAARPVQRENGAFELSLPACAEPKGTTVAFVYAAKTKALDPVSGQLALELPRTPLFIEHLEWSVAIPGNYEITAIDGNVTAKGGAKIDRERDLQSISLRKDFCRGERPAVALFYQRRSLEP
jgi:hypothetical protein